MPNPSPAASNDRSLRAMIGMCTAILVVAALYLGRTVFEPLAYALFTIAMVWPLQAWLQARLPALLALLASLLATVVVIAVFGVLVAWGMSRVGRYVAADPARFQAIYDQISVWLEAHGIVVAALWTEHFNVGWLLRLFQQVTNRINGTLTFSVIVLIYLILGLLEVDVAAAKLHAMKQGEAGRVLLAGSAATAVKLRRYMLVRTLMSVITGALVWGFVSLCGLPLAAEWGVIAFALNYIPFIGPLIATVLPTLFAIAQFQTWQMGVFVFASLNLIQFLVGSYVEPRVAGSVLSISPFLVLVAVFFWTFLWGMSGAFIGVPIVIAALTICAQHDSSRWVAELFGASGAGKSTA